MNQGSEEDSIKKLSTIKNDGPGKSRKKKFIEKSIKTDKNTPNYKFKNSFKSKD